MFLCLIITDYMGKNSYYITGYVLVHTVKAGGMRVVTKHKPQEKPDADAFDQKYIDQLPEQT